MHQRKFKFDSETLSMNEQFIKNIQVLKNAIADRKLVVFAGAGVSFDSGVPSWGELVDDLRKEISIPKDETDFLRIAQMYYNERQQKEFIDKIRQILKHKKIHYNDIHEILFDLNPEHIITTNFDDLLEQVIKAKALPFSVIKKDTQFPYGRNTKLLLKVHGDLDEANFVIKEDDYLEYSINHPLIESFIKGVFANKIVLFVGYSFSDIDLKIILQGVRNILGQDFQSAYMLSVEKNFHPAKRQYLKNKGITVINYDDAGMLYEMNAIEQYLFYGRNALNSTFGKKNESLSESGRKLFYLIKFITRYLDFEETILARDPVTQMNLSLARFNEIRVLPPTFVGNLFPFNNQKRFIHNYNRYTLGSNNTKISKFFFEEYDAEANQLKDDFFSIHSVAKERREDIETKLIGVIQKLNFSSIFFFGRGKQRIQLFEYYENFSETIELRIPDKKCDCLSCLYNELRIKDFLDKLNEFSISETSELQADLLLAYSHYKAGNFKTAYSQFEEIANKAWQLERYLTYYIAKQNIKHLRNLIDWRFDNISDENKRSIIEKIDDLDLDKLLFQIPTLGDAEYTLLKKIRDDEVLMNAETRIDEYYEKIVSIYENYKSGGTTTGTYYPNLIAEELHKIFYFYTYNYIVKDEFSNFKRVMQKGIKAFIICYSIEKYPQRLRSFDFWLLKFFILYGDDNEILKTLNNYEIKELKITSESISDAVEFLINLFRSVFNETKAFGKQISLDDNIAIQTKNFFFQDNFRTLTHNALLIFAGIKLPEENNKIIIKAFFHFLEVQDFLVRYSEKYLNPFLNNIRDYFSIDDYLEILRISVETEASYVEDRFFQIIGQGIKTRYPEYQISNEDLINAIITKHIDPKKHKHERGFMYLWEVSNSVNKKSIEQVLEKEFESKFEQFSYLNACIEGVIKPSLFYDKYIADLESHIPKDIVIEDNKIKITDFTFFNFINMIYYKNLLDDKFPFTQFDKYPEYWKFYFKPHDYDYSKFNPLWLLVVNREHVHQKLNHIDSIKLSTKEYLRKTHNEQLSIMYTKYYL